MSHDGDFEKEREENIARNKALIASLGINDNIFMAKKAPPQKIKPPKAVKRKADSVDEIDDQKPATKVVAIVDGETGELRRSGRNAGKKVDYTGDGDRLADRSGPRLVSEAARKADRESDPRSNLQRKYDP